MPCIYTENSPIQKLAVWEITEEADELYQLACLTDLDRQNYQSINALHRQKEWLSVRALLSYIHPHGYQIRYQSDGRPYFEGESLQLSISHSARYVAVMTHEQELPGIDIELINRNATRVSKRFLSQQETMNCFENGILQNKAVLFHWCAKEAVFKMVPFEEIEFSTDIQVSLGPISADSGEFSARFTREPFQVDIGLNYRLLHDLIMVYGTVNPDRFTII